MTRLPGRRAAAVLVPAINTGDPQAAVLSETAVRAALCAIGLGEGTGTTWVTTDGRWANGVLAGAGTRMPQATSGRARERQHAGIGSPG